MARSFSDLGRRVSKNSRTSGVGRSWFVLALLVLILGAHCGSIGITPIGVILADPYRYHNQAVTIAGTVTSAFNLIIVRTYTVQDATGEIAVVARNAVPKPGTTVRVKGKVNQALAVGDKSWVVLHELPR